MKILRIIRLSQLMVNWKKYNDGIVGQGALAPQSRTNDLLYYEVSMEIFITVMSVTGFIVWVLAFAWLIGFLGVKAGLSK